MEILKNGKYSCLKRTGDNYFIGDGLGKVDFPMTVRVTAVTGEQREAVLPSMQNDNNILSNVQFSGFKAGGKQFRIVQMKFLRSLIVCLFFFKRNLKSTENSHLNCAV